MLTGVVTSEGTGVRCGDALNERGNRRLLQLLTPHAEAERLGFKKESQGSSLEWARIKTRSRFEELIRFKVAKSLKEFSDFMSLVAGHVTGGGGKATTTKT
jgi:hypothetical protein